MVNIRKQLWLIQNNRTKMRITAIMTTTIMKAAMGNRKTNQGLNQVDSTKYFNIKLQKRYLHKTTQLIEPIYAI